MFMMVVAPQVDDDSDEGDQRTVAAATVSDTLAVALHSQAIAALCCLISDSTAAQVLQILQLI